MKILVLDSNPKTKETSHSKWAFDHLLKNIETPHDVDVWSLYKMEIPMIDQDVFSAWDKLQNGQLLNEVEQHKLNVRNDILEKFLMYDHYIVVSPLWNFGIPPQLKSFVDVVAVAGKTFKYTEKGPEGLLKGSFSHIQASGAIFSGELSHIEFGHRYISHMFKFMGLQEKAPLLIEGTNLGNFDRDEFSGILEKWSEEVLNHLEV